MKALLASLLVGVLAVASASGAPAPPPGPGLPLMPAAPPVTARALLFNSPALTAFHKKPSSVEGWVALPPGYSSGSETYPAVYHFAGFGGNMASLGRTATQVEELMAQKRLPPMIWVFLNHQGATGANLFADSANNGPWGQALTEEVVPYLERNYRMDARPTGRLLAGHSSGGWAAVWLQVRYPKLFGGTFPTAPDPAAFADFAGIDLYAPNANFYRDASGREIPMLRNGEQVLVTWEAQAKQEGARDGGLINSYEWVYSPGDGSGRPKPLFDRATGRIDPQVAAYWRENYDINHIVQRDWARLKPDLDGKIHITVGELDNYFYDRPARVLKTTLDRLGAKSDFTFVPGGTHGIANTDMRVKLGVDMYAVARPGVGFTPAPAPPPNPAPSAPRPPP